MDVLIRNSSKVPSPKKSKQSKSDIILDQGISAVLSLELSQTRLVQIDLSKYCPKKFFYIIFTNESSQETALILDNLVELSRNYEEISSVTFITREEVLNLLDTTQNVTFPNHLKTIVSDVVKSINGQINNEIPLSLEAQLLKLKLIQVMYQQYEAAVKRNQKEKKLDELLNVLSKECKKKQKKDEHAKEESPEKNKSPTRDDAKKKNKKEDKAVKSEPNDEDIDYTLIPLESDGISFEENVFDYIGFYCIKGYYNPDILLQLIDVLNTPVCSIIKVKDSFRNEENVPEHVRSFWERVDQQFFESTSDYKPLEDTMLMHFTASLATSTLIELFQEFVFVLRTIINIKLNHLQYLRYLAIHRMRNTYNVIPQECLHYYNRSIQYYPLECTNAALILDALLNEIRYDLESKHTSRSLLLTLSRSSSRSIQNIHCTDPLHDFEAFATTKKQSSIDIIKTNNNVKTFLTHEDDSLLKILKCCRRSGPTIFDTTLKLFKMNLVFQRFLNLGECDEDVAHTHDKDPSSEITAKEEEIMEHFMYLFLFSTFSNKAQKPPSLEKYDLTENLITYNLKKFWKSVQTASSSDSTESVADGTGLYDTSVIHFRWKEKLTSDLMAQKIFRALNEFSYVEQKYSPETDTFLVFFSDKLDEFGANTKIFEAVIRTPICLRDFCRYTTVEEAKWLKDHYLKIIDEESFKIELDEVCPGAQRVKAQMKIFQEYNYLLDGRVKDEELEAEEDEDDFKEEPAPDNFEQICNDLQNYPTSKRLLQECENAAELEQLLCYDLETKLFKLTGALTTFCSHDGVKVTVDNTRFLQSPEKCTASVLSNGHRLTLHSSKNIVTEPYIIQLLLADDTRISFIIKKEEAPALVQGFSGPELDTIDEENEEVIENTVYNDEIGEPDKEVHEEPTVLVNCVEEEFIHNIMEQGETLEKMPFDVDSDMLLEAVAKAKESDGVVYKINNKLSYLKRLNPTLKVPIEHALKNVLPRQNFIHKGPKPYKIYTKRYEVPNDDKQDLEVTKAVDFRICLPNGLFIRGHPCVVNHNNLMVKQEYIEEKPLSATVQHEEFRLFTYQGLVLIKKVDGTVRILRPSGDIIDFEKPCDGSGEENSLKPCHCSTFDDYRNKLNKMLKNEQNCDFSSRRGHINDKQNYIVDKKLLDLLEQFNVPYFKTSITRFDGRKIKIQGDKISQKQMYHMTSQQDFFTEEIFFERNDGFRSVFDRNGSQKVLFPDGTLISISVNISEELVDDFVNVTLSFQYEHPNYVTIQYDFNNALQMILNNDIKISKRVDDEDFRVSLAKDLHVAVSKEEVLLKKCCEDCLGSAHCKFNIKPFYEKSWNKSDTFLEVKDSYEKQFYCDFVGRCSRKSEYIKGPYNSFKCNHTKKGVYKNLFVINRNLSGEMLCTNELVKHYVKEYGGACEDTWVNTYCMPTCENITVTDCRRNCYVDYSKRFFNNDMLKNFHYFNKRSDEPKEIYSTYRQFYQMFCSVSEIEAHIANLQNIFFLDFPGSINTEMIFKCIASFTYDIEMYHNYYRQEFLDEIDEVEKKRKHDEELKRQEAEAQCLCIKTKMTIKNKIENWKNECEKYRKLIKSKNIPCYFNSEFCKVNKNEN